MIRHDAHRLAAKFKRMRTRNGLQRITTAPLLDGAEDVLRFVKRRNYGFKNRTGRLRRSMRIEQARDRRGRYATGYQIVMRAPYAAFVEFVKRTLDKREGPPYVLGSKKVRALLRRVGRKVVRDMRTNLRKEFRR